MGRRPTVNLTLPPRMRKRVQKSGRTFYYYDTGEKPRREIPLGDDYALAVKKWADLEIDQKPRHVEIITFRYVAEQYQAKVIPTKAYRTQRDNLKELAWLYKFFDNPPAPLDSIEPQHIARYRDWRKVTRSTQELALFSHIWNWSREQGYTALPNPTRGVRRNRAKGRNAYTTDQVFQAVYDHADAPLQDAMDLALLAAQRPGDSLRFQETDIRDGALHVQPSKTAKTSRKRVRIEITGTLGATIDRIHTRKAAIKHKDRGAVISLALVVNEQGQPLGVAALDYRFEKARTAAAKRAQNDDKGTLARDIRAFQFRDLRAKAATETEDRDGMEAAQALLAHADANMTKQYVRHRLGKLVKPSRA